MIWLFNWNLYGFRRAIFYILLLILNANVVLAATYYVDAAGGNDNADGLSPNSAWLTIARVNGSALQPGDRVLLKRGQIWYETLNVSSSGSRENPIRFGSYGDQERSPILTGAIDLTSPRFQWNRSQRGNNEYFITLAGGGNPSFSSPAYLWCNDRLMNRREIGSLYDLSWGYGDQDGLGYQTLYIRDNRGNPSLTGVKIESSSLSSVLSLSGKSNLVFEDIIFEKSRSNVLRMDGSSRSIQFINCVFRQSYGPVYTLNTSDLLFRNCVLSQAYGITSLFMMDGNESSVRFEYCHFDDSEGYLLEIQNGQSAELLNCLLIGSQMGNILNYSAMTVNAVNCIFAVPGKSRSSKIFLNQGAGKINTTHCSIMPNGHNPKGESFGNVNQANNIHGVPHFRSHRNRGIISINTDDTPHFWKWKLVADLAEKYGFRIGMAIYTKDMTDELWQDAREYVARGHEIQSHTTSHAFLTKNDSFSIQYTGNASQASLSFDRTILRINLSGNQTDGSQSLIIDATDPRYDSFQKLSEHINRQPGYSSWMTTQWHTRTSGTVLADVQGIDVKNPHQMQMDKARLFHEEIYLSKKMIEEKIPGYNCKVLIYPGGDYSDEIIRYAKDCGYLIARSVVPTINFRMENLPIFQVGAIDIPTFIDFNNIENNVHAICETANYTGSLKVLFDHGEPTLDQYEKLFQALKSYNGIQVMPLGKAAEYIRTHGTDLDGNGLIWSVPPMAQADYRLKETSPLIDAGAYINLTADFSGYKVPSGHAPEIGLHEFSGVKADPTPAPTEIAFIPPTPTRIPVVVAPTSTATRTATNAPSSTPTITPTPTLFIYTNNLFWNGLSGFQIRGQHQSLDDYRLSVLPSQGQTLEVSTRQNTVFYQDIPVQANKEYVFQAEMRSNQNMQPSIYLYSTRYMRNISAPQYVRLNAQLQKIEIVLRAQLTEPNAQFILSNFGSNDGRIWISNATLLPMGEQLLEISTPTPSLPPSPTPTSTPTSSPTVISPTPSPTMQGSMDINGDLFIGEIELCYMIEEWKKNTIESQYPQLDANRDGVINKHDLFILTTQWRQIP